MFNDLSLLFVEDDHTTQEQFRNLFGDEFKAFYQAYNGHEGLNLYRAHSPDIILTDLKMPEVLTSKRLMILTVTKPVIWF
jgi:CheY-like chemotaxis protein